MFKEKETPISFLLQFKERQVQTRRILKFKYILPDEKQTLHSFYYFHFLTSK